MNRLKLFWYFSLKYFKVHKARALYIVFPILICAASVFCICNLKISFKIYDYQKSLEQCGNCDFIFYDVNENEFEKILDSSNIKQAGYLKRYCSVEADGVKYAIGYADENAQKMLPITLDSGKYPELENEVLVTKELLQKLGIMPNLNEEITLLFNGENFKFTVSGIMPKYYAQNGKRYLLHRYNYDINSESEETSYPEIYVSKAFAESFLGDSEFYEFQSAVMFDVNINADFDDYTLYSEIMENKGDLAFLNDRLSQNSKCCIRSSTINSNVINFQSDDPDSANTWGYNSVRERLYDGSSRQDFVTIFVIPILSGLIIAIAVISMVGTLKFAVSKRKNQFETLLVLGMSKLQIFICICGEIIIFSIIGTVLGTLIGRLVYDMILWFFDEKLPSFSEADYYIKNVTISPIPLIFLIGISALIFGIIASFFTIYKKPRSKIKFARFSLKSGFLAILSLRKRNGKLTGNNSITVYVAIFILTISTVFSYIYFVPCQKNSSAEINEYPYGTFYAERNYNSCITDDYFENHHDSGIEINKVNMLFDNKNIEGIYASIINGSSKLCYDFGNEINSDFEKASTSFTAKGRKSTDDFEEIYAQDVNILKQLGYSENERLYCAPMVGIQDEYIKKLEEFVIDGEINIDKIKSGEEIILMQSKKTEKDPLYDEYKRLGLALPQTKYLDLSKTFSAGDCIPLTDVIYDYNAENSYNINISTAAYSELGGQGKRIDFSVKIGAIIEVTDNQLFNLIWYNMYDGSSPLLNIICSNETFSKLKLPDKNVSKLYVKLNENSDYEEFENEWLRIVFNSKNISFDSMNDILKENQEKNKINFLMFSAVFVVLTVVGISGIIITIRYECSVSNEKICLLYNMGIPPKYLFLYYSFHYFCCTAFSIMIAILLSGFAQNKLDDFSQKIDSILMTEINVKGENAYWQSLLPIGSKWFSISELMLPIMLILILLTAVILFSIVPQIKKVRIKNMKRG